MDEKKDKNIEFGNQGEDIATDYLISKGYKIIERNWRYRHKEIDIIAQSEKLLVVVEVKIRTSAQVAMPHLAVNKEKQSFLIDAANNYVMRKNLDIGVRFDIIAIWYEGKKQIIDHVEDAFYPRW